MKVTYLTLFGVQIDELEKDFRNRSVQKLDELVSLMYNGDLNELRIALNDLRLAIQHPKDTGVFCFRAIESLRYYFSMNKDKGWKDLKDNLNVSRSFMKPIEDKSWSSRHGRPIPISHKERINILLRTWKIVDRFIIYVKSGGKRLDPNRYEEL